MEHVFQIVIVFAAIILFSAFVLLFKRLVVHLYKTVFGIYKRDAEIFQREQEYLRNPNWNGYQKYLGRNIPKTFKEFYSKVALEDPPVFKVNNTEFLFFGIGEFDDNDDIAIAWSELGEPVYFKRGSEIDNKLYYYDGSEDCVLFENTAEKSSYENS